MEIISWVQKRQKNDMADGDRMSIVGCPMRVVFAVTNMKTKDRLGRKAGYQISEFFFQIQKYEKLRTTSHRETLKNRERKK